MAELVSIPTESSHWYAQDGTPCYSVPCKARPGEMRPTTLSDARKLGLRPSVTSIDRVINNHALETWKQKNLVLAALTLPRRPGEGDDEFATRIVDDAKSLSREAADLGTEFHRLVEQFHVGLPPWSESSDPRLYPMLDAYKAWSETTVENVVATEPSFSSKLGYGGRIDLIVNTKDGQRVLIDLKTKTTKAGEKMRPWDSYGRQLSAYAEGLGEPETTRLWNVIVSTTEPGRIEVVDWTEQRAAMFQTFQHAFEIWVAVNKYDPRKEASNGTHS